MKQPPPKPAFDKVEQLCSLVNGILKREKELLARVTALEKAIKRKP